MSTVCERLGKLVGGFYTTPVKSHSGLQATKSRLEGRRQGSVLIKVMVIPGLALGIIGRCSSAYVKMGVLVILN